MSAIPRTPMINKCNARDLAKTALKRSAIRGETLAEASAKKVLAVKVAKSKFAFSPIESRIVNDLDNSWGDYNVDHREPGCRLVTQNRWLRRR